MHPVEPAADPQFWAGYPPWLVVLVAGLVLALVFWLFAKAARVIAILLALGAIGVATWLAWEHLFR